MIARIHTLVEKDSTDDVVTRAIVNHGGRIFIHCISTEYESGMPKRATEVQPMPVKGRLSKDERSKWEDSVMVDEHHVHNRTVAPIVQVCRHMMSSSV